MQSASEVEMNLRAFVIVFALLPIAVACGGSGSGTSPMPVATATPTPAPPTISYYALPAGNTGTGAIAVGPDGNLWFTDTGPNYAAEIGKITLQGTIAEFSLPSPDPSFQAQAGSTWFANGIATGPDGNLWVTVGIQSPFDVIAGCLFVQGEIDKITVGGSTIAQYNTTYLAPFGITAGPDGNLWFTATNTGETCPGGPASFWSTEVAKISTSGAITAYDATNNTTTPSLVSGITAGPDGNLWFPNTNGTTGIGKITTQGTATVYTVTGLPTPQPPWPNTGVNDIVVGPDKNLWFTTTPEGGGGFSHASDVGKITTTGASVLYPTPTALSGTYGITLGPDGNLWFTENNVNKIGMITPSGDIIEYPLLSIPEPFPLQQGPSGIVTAPDGSMWFTDGSKDIGKIVLPVASLAGFRRLHH